MEIPLEMTNDKIKASADYLNHLAKCMGTQPAKGEGSGVNLKVPNWPSDSSTSLHFGSDDKIKDISSDDERTKVDDSNKADKEKAEDDKLEKNAEEEQAIDEQAGEEQAIDEQAGEKQAIDKQAEINQPRKVQSDVREPQVKKPAPQLLSYILTLSLAEYEIQIMVEAPVLQENPAIQRPPLVDTTVTLLPETTTHLPKQQPPKRSNRKVFLKKLKKREEKVNANAVLQRLTKLEKKVVTNSKINHTKAIEEFVQANVTNKVKNQLPNYLPKAPPSTSVDSLTEYELKLKLYNMMQNSRSFLDHEKYLTLYNALINSMDIDEANGKRKRKDADTSSSKKDDEELIQDDMEDDDMAADDMPHEDDGSTQDWSKWFKQVVVVRPVTPDPEWYKEPNADDAPE
uniref:Uncharacterized protein n=1 Tax=Tanacetum cinerariifolium TaxID=118510 RepID=A0A699GVD4_TANCI|nr:hypothetical protein [Tanacetum cinerariifolium]